MEERIKQAVRDIHGFPKPGIVFKDITPILKDPSLCKDIVSALADALKDIAIDVVAGIESRGFLFGPSLAQKLNVPFVPVRKIGKLPYRTVSQSYDLEYGSASIECHADAFLPDQKVLLHDDLLATGGTIAAASELTGKLGAKVVAYSFLISLDFLQGRERLKQWDAPVFALSAYQIQDI